MSSTGSGDHPCVYQIHVLGLLDESWSIWFDGMAIEQQHDGSTRICGIVRDQAALHGLLAKVRDLGLVLLSVSRIP